ncbi:MAG: hypothetical protein HY934_03985 [Candidatus Firestonebacteria bacterium]|nr:hypothetical protein [Candidatus Firestonebacteria bacterium]
MKENFKWEDIHKELDFLPGGKLNLAYEAIDRHTLAGVIGIPDPVRMEVVKAFISLREGYVASPELKLEIKKFVTEKLDANAAPKEIEILPVDIRFKNTKFV